MKITAILIKHSGGERKLFMKIIAIYLLLFLLIISYDIFIDLLQGMTPAEAAHIVAEAFSATTVTEKVLIAFCLPAPLFPAIWSFVKQKTARRT